MRWILTITVQSKKIEAYEELFLALLAAMNSFVESVDQFLEAEINHRQMPSGCVIHGNQFDGNYPDLLSEQLRFQIMHH